MITNKILSETIRKAVKVSGSEMMLKDKNGKIIVNTFDNDDDINKSFEYSINKDGESYFTLYVYAKENAELTGSLLSLQLESLMEAYEDKLDKSTFFLKVITGAYSDTDLSGMIKRLHIKGDICRCVYIINPVGHGDNSTIEIVKELFNGQTEDIVIQAKEEKIILIKALDNGDEAEEVARMLADMVSAEAMQSVKIAYGSIVDSIDSLAKSYNEAKMALEIGEIFYIEKAIIAYTTLGIGRLIYQLPTDLCRLYVKEIFGDNVPEDIDDEMLSTINKFFENNLNVSETSRQLSMHRNTLLYRIEKVQKATGLDIRIFDDALALKIALMVVNYMKYIEDK